MESFSATLQKIEGSEDLMIELPEAFSIQNDWRIDDVLDLQSRAGAIYITNKTRDEREKLGKSKLFIVEAISSFRMQYAVLAGSAEEANMIIGKDAASDFFQAHLGEQITSTREVSHSEYMSSPEFDNGCSEEIKNRLICSVLSGAENEMGS